MIIACIEAVLFYCIPALIGRALFLTYGMLRKTSDIKSSISYPVIVYFIVGALATYLVALIGNYLVLPLFPTFKFIDLFRPTITLLIIFSVFVNIWQGRNTRDIFHKKYFLPLLTAAFFSIPTYVLWLIRSPYTLNWDFLEHQTVVHTILTNNFSFMTSHISDTFGFNSYSSMPHILLTVSQLYWYPSVNDFWQSISFVHLYLVTCASYLLIYQITKSKLAGILSALFGALIFEQVTFTSLFFIPQTFTAVVFIFSYTKLLADSIHHKRTNLLVMMATILFLFLNHYIVGTAAVGLYALTYYYYHFKHVIDRYVIHNKKTLIITGSLLAIASIFLSTKLNLGFINQGEGEAFTFNLYDKFMMMKQAYGYLLVVLLPTGLFMIIRRKNADQLYFSFIAFCLFITALLQLPYFLKFYVLGRFFIHGVMSIGLAMILYRLYSKTAYILTLIFIVMSVFIIYLMNISTWKSILHYDSLLTNISPQEQEAADFLANTYDPHTTLLISDPATAYILEGLSGINSPGGAFTGVDTRRSLIRAYSQARAEELHAITDRIAPEPQKRLYVTSGRFFVWQRAREQDQLGIDFNVWVPYSLSFEDRAYIARLASNTEEFSLVYQNSVLAIFELK